LDEKKFKKIKTILFQINKKNIIRVYTLGHELTLSHPSLNSKLPTLFKAKLAWTRILIEPPGSLKRRSKKYEIINWNMHNTDAWQHLGFILGL
jgi:hypothetical protein